MTNASRHCAEPTCNHYGMHHHCPSCGLVIIGSQLCAHHAYSGGDDGWARANKVWCDYFHRGVPIKRLTPQERDDDFWAHTGEGTVDAA